MLCHSCIDADPDLVQCLFLGLNNNTLSMAARAIIAYLRLTSIANQVIVEFRILFNWFRLLVGDLADTRHPGWLSFVQKRLLIDDLLSIIPQNPLLSKT